MQLCFTLLLVLLLGNIYAQNRSNYLFIEPNVSFRYDDALIKVRDSVANPVYGLQTYGFTIDLPNRTKTYFQVGANRAVVTPDKDSIYNARVNQVNRYAGDSIVITGKRMVWYKGFTGIGYTAFHKRSKKYSVAFSCAKYFEDGACEVYYHSTGKQRIGNSDNDYVILTSILDSITTHSLQEAAHEGNTVQRQYTVIVDSLDIPALAPNATFTGIVRTKEKLEHTIKGVQIDVTLFQPDYRGNVIVYCIDTQKGRITRQGALILLNKDGKELRVPFTFSYYNTK